MVPGEGEVGGEGEEAAGYFALEDVVDEEVGQVFLIPRFLIHHQNPTMIPRHLHQIPRQFLRLNKLLNMIIMLRLKPTKTLRIINLLREHLRLEFILLTEN